MRLVLLGPPGSGKGTQAGRVSAEFGIPKISTGDILREAIEEKTDLGRKAADFVEAGRLVPDGIMLPLVEERIGRADCSDGFILDGFPRTLVQAEGLGRMLAGRGEALDAVLFIDVGEETVVSRLSRRRVCPGCGAPYSSGGGAGREPGVCGKCGRGLGERADDDPETVRKRLEVYRKATLPLVEHYGERGLLKRIDGEGTVDEVFASILDGMGRPRDRGTETSF